MSLLDSAKKIKTLERKHREITKEHIDLITAFLKHEINARQMTLALGYGEAANVGYFVMRVVKKMFDDNIIILNKGSK